MTPQHETNGRIKLTWAQLVWGVGMLGGLFGMWMRMETRMTRLEEQVCAKASAIEVMELRTKLDSHILVGSAEAATRRNP